MREVEGEEVDLSLSTAYTGTVEAARKMYIFFPVEAVDINRRRNEDILNMTKS